MILAILPAFAAIAKSQLSDPVTVSFAYFGCDRVDVGDWKKDPTSNPSSANLPEVLQNLKNIAGLPDKPDKVFLCGDIVANYRDDDGTILKGQLAALQASIEALSEARALPLVAFPGNHELNQKKDGDKIPNLVTDPIWTEWLAKSPFSPGVWNGPTPASDPDDKLANDQSKLNMTFVIKGVKFIVLNTDARTTEIDTGTKATKVAWIPAYWAANEIASAETNASVNSVVVLGHRNLIDPDSVKGDSPINPGQAKVLLDAIKGCHKVKLFACSHVHAWDAKQIAPGSWQVVEGRGGSPFEKGWNPKEGQTFGFTQIKFHQSGKVEMCRFSRPADGHEPAKCDMTRVLD